MHVLCLIKETRDALEEVLVDYKPLLGHFLELDEKKN